MRDLDLVVSLFQVECGVAVALQNRIPHGGGLLLSAFWFISLDRFPIDAESHVEVEQLHVCEVIGRCCGKGSGLRIVAS